ncbi:hypothetical protein SP15_060 [Bacillus phage SP-15]|uniref:Uncharacterized protein n=1 Tax=Bacillus phage SP-15 TaxID=1792032 RepID=A0A127AW14_9CAUD|nr:hypothetical protein SP15_060 [Bacillus phage SP-15]AMM44859.1 hypothetical protein SP15_060 [Bacillus phage SP-15]
MESVFSKINGMSPVAQDFIWLGEYLDGTHLSEFGLETKEENSFYDIQRDKLLRFGLIGHGLKLYFEVDGVFNLAGQAIELEYRVGDKVYPLTGLYGQSRDIITYKDAEALLNPAGGKVRTQINQYTFGYKTELDVQGIKFNLKALCVVPYGKAAYMNLRLVSDSELEGTLVVKKNNRVHQEIKAPLSKGVGGEVNIII